MKVSGCRILLVEDQPIISLMVADALEEMGAIVIGLASCLDDALRLASTADFDVALLDIWLGGVVVFPVGEVLRRRGIPFIVLSGGVSTAEEPEFFRTAGRLLKPVRNDELRAAIEAV